MIKTDANKNSLKAIREKDKSEKEARIKKLCEDLAVERFGQEKVVNMSNSNKGIWYLPVMDETGEVIEKLAIMKPIDRHILSYASTKINDDGLYIFLEACMRECWLEGDKEILDDDEYFIPASNSFNKIMEGKKAFMLKR